MVLKYSATDLERENAISFQVLGSQQVSVFVKQNYFCYLSFGTRSKKWLVEWWGMPYWQKPAIEWNDRVTMV